MREELMAEGRLERQGRLQFLRHRTLKEKLTRLYIVRRCILLLIFWREQEDE
ncbi:hypothetical protein SLEP1_g2236 [Rubroshorea leprosula]|uniref:Uncharacterized protein n=1 Tax=Rubroshorea leprosula TaxID=152421 RepID=A0AAV5HRU4_9ROSI|nr:hypothetical protein SLEP1_g2236 [Rubroshorea leprosula]